MTGLVVIGLAFVLGLIFLAYVWTDRRHRVTRRELHAARTQADAALEALGEVEKEICLQLTANRPDLQFLYDLTREQTFEVLGIASRKRKELT